MNRIPATGNRKRVILGTDLQAVQANLRNFRLCHPPAVPPKQLPPETPAAKNHSSAPWRNHQSWLAALTLTLTVFGTTVFAGELELDVVDDATGRALPARIELTSSKGRHPHPKRVPFFHNHFSTPGSPIVLRLGKGKYQYRVSAGPEYLEEFGSFDMKSDATDHRTFRLKRFVDLHEQGWCSGDSWYARPATTAADVARSEDLHFLAIVPRKTKITTKSSAQDSTTSDTEKPTAAPKTRPAPRLTKIEPEDPCIDPTGRNRPDSAGQLHLFGEADQRHYQVADPADWDFPAWIAMDRVDSIVIHRPHASTPDPRNRPRDTTRFPDKPGAGRYREWIYHQLLNTGISIAPAAASGSGTFPVAAGEYRTYAQLGLQLSRSQWWQAVDDGLVVITNGPLMAPRVNGEFPGHRFRAAAGESIELTTALSLHTREKIDYLQFVKNGQSVGEIRLDEWAKKKNQTLPTVSFDESGWMIVRAVTNHPDEYRYAATGPYYVEIGSDEDGANVRISRSACQFFLDWVTQRSKMVRDDRLANQLQSRAIEFWSERRDSANAP